MKNFNRGGGFGDKKSGGFGDRREGGFGHRDSGGRDFNRGGFSDRSGGGSGGFGARPAMHQATCAECGASCEVPFKPSGERPVYCSNCFKTKGGADTRSARPTDSRSFSRPSFGSQSEARPAAVGISKEQFEALNAKMDKVLRALELILPANQSVKAAPVASKAPVIAKEAPAVKAAPVAKAKVSAAKKPVAKKITKSKKK